MDGDGTQGRGEAEVSEKTKIDDGGPAFPQGHLDGPHTDPSGMTLRDWFAGQAMLGMLANCCLMRNIATDCYGLAEVMLKVRRK